MVLRVLALIAAGSVACTNPPSDPEVDVGGMDATADLIQLVDASPAPDVGRDVSELRSYDIAFPDVGDLGYCGSYDWFPQLWFSERGAPETGIVQEVGTSFMRVSAVNEATGTKEFMVTVQGVDLPTYFAVGDELALEASNSSGADYSLVRSTRSIAVIAAFSSIEPATAPPFSAQVPGTPVTIAMSDFETYERCGDKADPCSGWEMRSHDVTAELDNQRVTGNNEWLTLEPYHVKAWAHSLVDGWAIHCGARLDMVEITLVGAI